MRRGGGFYNFERHHFYSDANITRKTIDIPQGAVGLILGKKGRNIKELNKVPGIIDVRYNNRTQQLTMRGTAAAVNTVDDKVFLLTTQSMSTHRSFPMTHLVNVPVDLDLGCSFEQVFDTDFFQDLQLTIPDDHCYRNYFVISLHQDMLQLGETNLLPESLKNNCDQPTHIHRRPCNKIQFQPGFEELYLDKFISSLQQVYEESQTRTQPEIELRLGKNFFHDIAPEATDVHFAAHELQEIEISGNLRSQFLTQLNIEALARFENRLIDLGYELCSSQERIKIVMVDEQTYKSYTVTLIVPVEIHHQSEEKKEGVFATSADHASSIERVFSATSYYEVLGISETSSKREIIVSYRKAAKSVHPDKNKNGMATEAFKLVATAYECLKDPEKRREHDAHPTLLVPQQVAAKGKDMPPLPQPQVSKLTANRNKVYLLDVANGMDSLDFRLALETYEDEANHNPDVLEYIQESWQKQVGGKMQFPSGRRFRLSTVRYKTEQVYEGNSFRVTLHTVSQDNRGDKTDVPEHLEVSVKSLVLSTLLRQKQLEGYELETAREEARLMLQEAKTLTALN